MAIISCIKSMNGGKFSPLLKGRDEYVASCKTLMNMIPTVQGPLKRRGGTKYVADITGAVRIVPFVFSPVQVYLFVFYADKIDILLNGAAYASLSVSYAAEDIPFIYITQIQDVMYLAHSDYPTKKIVRSVVDGAASFAISEVEFTNGPYLDENITDITVSASGTTLTTSAALLTAADVGRWIHFETVDNGTTKCADAKITAVANSTTVTIGNISGEFHTGVATKMWRLSPFSAALGYPEAVCYHQERLYVAKSGRVYAPVQSGGTNFLIKKPDGTVLETHGFSVNLAVEKGADIYWLTSSEMLMIGTLSYEYGITSGTFGYAVTPTNKKPVKAYDVGSCALKPETTDDGIVFVDLYRRSVHFLRYSAVYENFEKSELTKFNPDITRGKIKETAMCQRKTPVYWACLQSGKLIGCTLSIKDNVVAWFDADVSGKVVSLCALPDMAKERDDLYLAVKREIGGITKTYLEKMTEGLPEADENAVNAVYVDCAKEIDLEQEQTEITGLNYLEGINVDILADGGVQPSKTVMNGKIKLQSAAKHVIVGIGYKSIVEPSAIVPAEGRERTIKHISKIEAMFLDTLGGKAGVDEANAREFVYYTANQTMGVPMNLFSGVKEIGTGGKWSKEANVCIVQDLPLPMTIQALYVTMEI